MKFFLISDNIDTCTVLRLAGIEGVVAHTREVFIESLTKACEDEDIGVILVTERAEGLAPEEVAAHKRWHSRPLILRIPDRHGQGDVQQRIDLYLQDAIGLAAAQKPQ